MARVLRTSLMLLAALAITDTTVNAKALDVKSYGAKADGKTDDSKAFADAWQAACESPEASTIEVAKGEYMVNGVEFKGPCKGQVTINIQGNLKAPAQVTNTKPNGGWINLIGLQDFVLNGNGAIFDGQGALAWKMNDCAKTGKCNSLPINIVMTSLTNSKINGITSSNSKLFHMNIINCKNLTLEDIGIDAPPESLNTDGIHIGRSNGVYIMGAHVKTGDDCVSLGDGSENVNIERVECGPGHGIAIGSLGRYPNEQPVRGVTVKNCTIKNTMNGVRVKTWPGSPDGIASNLHFEDVVMENVSTPVLIDQQYCPYGHCQSQTPSKVKLSDISFKNIRGTSNTKEAVRLVCSKGVPCTNIELSDINLTYEGKDGPAISECANITPKLSGKNVPPICAVKAEETA